MVLGCVQPLTIEISIVIIGCCGLVVLFFYFVVFGLFLDGFDVDADTRSECNDFIG